MAGDDEGSGRRGGGPGMVTVLVLLSLLAVGYQAVFGPDAQATSTGPAAGVGDGVSTSGWVVPVAAPVWSGFRTQSRPGHDGVDLGAPRGTPILAASAGVVVRVRCNASLNGSDVSCDVDGSPRHRGCGWYVDLRHAGDVFTRYCHMQARPVVVVDQAVAAGDVLGHVGSSGRSSAPHLHFEVHLGDQSEATAVDPVAFMAEHGAPLGQPASN